MGLEINVFLTYVGAIILIFIFGRIFLWPLKMILKLCLLYTSCRVRRLIELDFFLQYA